LAGLLDQVGWVQDVIVNQRTGHVVDGHLRVALAIGRQEAAIPVVYVDLSEHEEQVVLASLDPLGAMAATDTEMLRGLLDDVAIDSDDLRAALEKLSPSAPTTGLTDPDAVPEEPAATVAKRGEIWRLGNHRLMCGDSTIGADVAALMNGARAAMVWTDPPYGVAIGDKNKYLNSIAPSNRVEENLTNDTLDEDGLLVMLRQSLGNAAGVCEAGAAWYVAAPAVPLHLRFGEVLRDLGIYRQTLIWAKNNATFSPLGVSYHWAHEPIFYGWMPDGAHRYYGDRKQTTVWQIDRPTASPAHPTMKPVALVARAIEHSAAPGELIYEPFSGSGTTIIAAEQLGRRCYAMEIEPRYVDVAVQRWEEFTGRKAERG